MTNSPESVHLRMLNEDTSSPPPCPRKKRCSNGDCTDDSDPESDNYYGNGCCNNEPNNGRNSTTTDSPTSPEYSGTSSALTSTSVPSSSKKCRNSSSASTSSPVVTPVQVKLDDPSKYAAETEPLTSADVTFGGLEGFDKVDTTKDSYPQYLKFTFCHVGILLLLVGYTAAGAFVFVTLEHPHERETKFLKRSEIFAKEREIYGLFAPKKSGSGPKVVSDGEEQGNRNNSGNTTYPQLRRSREVSSGKRAVHKRDVSTAVSTTRQPIRNRPAPTTLVRVGYDDWDPGIVSQNMDLALKMKEYASLLLHNSKHFELDNGSIVMKPYQWTLTKAMFFSATVISTIGYGNIAPETTYGRIFCIIYAIFGIPLLLLVVADLGTLFAQFIHFTWVKFSTTVEKNVVSVLHMGNNELRKITKKIKVPKHNLKLPIYAALLLLAFYMAAGAGLFLLWEDWTFFESFYFVFITMTTIGFGDIVPEHTNYLLLMMVYILVGLATMTMCVELVIHTYVDKLKLLRNRVRFVTEKTEETLRTETLKKYLQNPEIITRIKNMSTKKKYKKGVIRKDGKDSDAIYNMTIEDKPI